MKKAPEQYRVRTGPLASHPLDGNNGCFVIPRKATPFGVGFECIISDGEGWEHVSVKAFNAETKETGVPLWEEMCWIKDQFWEPEEVVIQYHPAKSAYMNVHPHVLHLWRPTRAELPTPPSIFVGPRNADELAIALKIYGK